MSQFQTLIRFFFKPTEYKPKTPPSADKSEKQRRNEIRELEEMLGLRPSRLKKIPKIKVTSPEELEREKKINKIKEVNRLRQPSFQVEETASALTGFEKQFRIQGIGGISAREFMTKSEN